MLGSAGMVKQGETTHMLYMQFIKTILKPKVGVIATLVMVGLVASVMGLAPTHGASNTLAQDCPNPPTAPVFNYWPVTYQSGTNTPFCHDFSAIDAAVDTTNLQWSHSEADWNDGLTLTTGQVGVAGIYIHNGAANNLPISQTTAQNVHIITRTETTVGTDHQISVTFTADNAAPYTKSFTIHTPANSRLEVIPNTGYMYDYQNHIILDQQGLNLGNSDFPLGVLDACFEYSLFLTYKFKVVTPITPPTGTTLSIDKGVRNITNDPTTRFPAYSPSVNAKQDDQVGYKIVVTNTGSNVAQNVTMTDNSVSGINVDPGSTIVGVADDALLANNLWQGAIPGTINLGNLQPGESRIIKYTGHVRVNSGTLTNIATAVASNATQVQDTAAVIVTQINNGNPNLSIQKWVKNNTTGNAYSDSTVAYNGDRVNFKVTITNTGNADLLNARIADAIPDGLLFDDSVSTDGTSNFDNNTLTVMFNNALTPGQSKTVEFAAKVTANSERTICNIARATGTNVSEKQDNACVTVTVPHTGNPRIAIDKLVKNDTNGGSYSNSVNVRTNDRVKFKVTVSNTGNTTLNNVVMTDNIPSGLRFDDSVSGDGTPTINSNNTFSVDFGSISSGSSKTVEFAAKVTASGSNTICNTARATATNVGSVQDDACVNLSTNPPHPGNPNIVLSKRAFNDTKNIDATTTSAARGDYITYTLVTTNNGSADANNYVIQDDLSQVLALADIVSTNGGTISGNTITFPSTTIRAGATVTKTFQVRIKQTLSTNLAYQLSNTYGNTVIVNVPGTYVYVAPTTGAAGTSAAAFAGLLTVGFIAFRKRTSIFKFISA
jgi:uncharacterized repeat protein (TIGR01451 family)